MKSFLIDPSNKTITAADHTTVQAADELAQIRHLVDCQWLERVRLNDANVMWLDEEGGLGPYPHPDGYWRFGQNTQWFAGKALVLGIDRDGEACDATLTLGQLQLAIEFPAAAPSKEAVTPHVEILTGDAAKAAILGGVDEEPATYTPDPVSYRPMVCADRSGSFAGNALRFATPTEAESSARDLMSRWMLVTDIRVDPSQDPVNYCRVDGRDIPLERAEAMAFLKDHVSVQVVRETPAPSYLGHPVRELLTIAQDIRKHWPKVYFGAVPYLNAMSCLHEMSDRYGADDASEIVARFLSNATTWRGDDARRIKAELNRMLRKTVHPHRHVREDAEPYAVTGTLKLNVPERAPPVTWGTYVFADEYPQMQMIRAAVSGDGGVVPHFGAAEFRGDRDGKIDVVFLYASDDPAIDAEPCALYKRTSKGRMVRVSEPLRRGTTFLMDSEGHVVKKGESYADHRQEFHRVKGWTPPRHEGSTGRVHTDHGDFYPGVIDCQVVTL